MPTYYVYSVEPMPRVDLFNSRDYNPVNDYIGYNGIYIPSVPAKTWTALPDRLRSVRHLDRSDKQGHAYHVFPDEIIKANEVRLKSRGVIFTDHLPEGVEKAELEAEAEKHNLEFRMASIQEYESNVEETKTLPGGKPPRCNTYVLECYKVLGMERPGSVEALRAQRQPGEAAADRFAKALEATFEKFIARMEARKEEASAPTSPKTVAGSKPAPASSKS